MSSARIKRQPKQNGEAVPAVPTIADLPGLPRYSKRRLQLSWRTLLETHGFTGAHLRWQERDRRRASIALAQAWFGELFKEYWWLWGFPADDEVPDSEVYVGWVDTAKQQILTEVGSLWAGSKLAGKWWKSKGEAAVEAAVEDLAKQEKARARDKEIQQLIYAESMGVALQPPAESAAEGGIPSSAQADPAEAANRENPAPASASKQAQPAVPDPPAGMKRRPATIKSLIAARRLEAYLDFTQMGLNEFAGKVPTTEKTLRSFRKTGKIRRDLFDGVAKAMGTTRGALLKRE